MSHYTLRDAGESMQESPLSAKMEKFFQHLNFDISQLPEIGTWKVGEDYLLVVQVREVSHSIREENDKDAVESAGFEVRKVAAFDPTTEVFGDTVQKKLRIK